MALAVSLQDLLPSGFVAQPTRKAPCAAPHTQKPPRAAGCWSSEHTPRSYGLHGQDGLSSLLTAESLGMFSQFSKGLKPKGALWGR